MPTLTRKTVFESVRAKYPTNKARAALSQKLGKNWSHASTENLARAIGLQQAPRKTSQSSAGARATAQRHGVAKSFAADSAAHRLTGGDQSKQTAAKQRIVRAVNRDLKAHEKTLGRKLTPDEKRKVAIKALHGEVKAIKAGKAETKPAGRKKAHQMHLAEYAAARNAPKHVVKDIEAGDRHSPEASKLLSAHRKAVAKAIDAGQTPAPEAIGEHGREFRKMYHYRSRAEADLKAGKPVPDSVVAMVGEHFPGFKAKYGRKAEGRGQKAEGGAKPVAPTPESGYQAMMALQSRLDAAYDKRKEQEKSVKLKPAPSSDAVVRPYDRVTDSMHRTQPGKLTDPQQRAITAHLRAVDAGEKQAIPLRALQDEAGQHWLEMQGRTGVGAVPIDHSGRHDTARAVSGEAWQQQQKSMKVVSVMPAGRQAPPSNTVRKTRRKGVTGQVDQRTQQIAAAPVQGKERSATVRGVSIE